MFGWILMSSTCFLFAGVAIGIIIGRIVGRRCGMEEGLDQGFRLGQDMGRPIAPVLDWPRKHRALRMLAGGRE